jgi:hypothetical protein
LPAELGIAEHAVSYDWKACESRQSKLIQHSLSINSYPHKHSGRLFLNTSDPDPLNAHITQVSTHQRVSAELRVTSPTQAKTYNHPDHLSPDTTDLGHLNLHIHQVCRNHQAPSRATYPSTHYSLSINPPSTARHVLQRPHGLRQAAPRRRLLQHQGQKVRHVQGQRTLSPPASRLDILHYQRLTHVPRSTGKARPQISHSTGERYPPSPSKPASPG